jgi:hypothetical protein
MCHKAATAKRRLFEKPRQRAGMVEMEMRNLEHYNNTYAKNPNKFPPATYPTLHSRPDKKTAANRRQLSRDVCHNRTGKQSKYSLQNILRI